MRLNVLYVHLVAILFFLIVETSTSLANPGTAIHVNTTADELINNGNCSLREAILAANTDTAIDACPAGSGADIIHLLAGTYLLAIPGTDEDGGLTGDLDISDHLTISGAGQATTIIDAGNLDRAFHITRQDAVVVISNLRIQNGFVPEAELDGGGGILSAGNLTLDAVQVTQCSAVRGGGISTTQDSLLVMTNSTVNANASELEGGGIYAGGSLSIFGSSIRDNTSAWGAGVSNDAHMLIQDSTISGNTATGQGGGVFSDYASQIRWVTIKENSAVQGGGIYVNRIAQLENTTLNDNTASERGGAIYNTGLATLVNLTLSGNQATSGGGETTRGGAVFNDSTLSLLSVTIFNNQATQGGGILNDGGNISLNHSILAGSLGGNCLSFFPGTMTSQGYNLSDDNSCPLFANGDRRNTQPLLGPLQDNSGPTHTHALLAGSPAIERGDNLACTLLDQRGFVRPIDADKDGNPVCDIGAVEALPDPYSIIRFQPVTYSVGEGGNVVLTIVREVSSHALSVDYQTQGGTATAGLDFVPVSGSLSWGDGDMAPKTITLTTLDDIYREGDETVQLVLSNPGIGGVLVYPGYLATVTIIDDDLNGPPPPASLPVVFRK